MKLLRQRLCTNKRVFSSRARGGFTLLETLIAVALLMIATIIVYRGFASTMQYSSNTAQFAKTAQAADKSIKLNLSAGDSLGAVSPDGALYLSGNYEGTSFAKVLPVKEYSASPTPSQVVVGDGEFTESNFVSVRRHGFAYSGRVCPTCHAAPLQWYKDGANYYAFCSDSSCPFDEGTGSTY